MGKTTGFLTKGYTATTAIPKRTIVKFGAADGTVVPATAAADFSVGISSDIDTAIGERCDAFMNGNIADCVYGATVARGASVNSDSAGRAVTALTGVRAIGYAEVSGVVGDIGSIIVAPHTAA